MSARGLKGLSSGLQQLLGLRWKPIAVKLVTKEDHETLPDESSRRLRYCQLLMEAKKGKSLSLTAESISCPAAASALGFLPLPEKISSGEMLEALGLFTSRKAAAKTMARMPRMKHGKIKAVATAPLEEAKFTPDVIIVEDQPEKVMWLNLAAIHEEGGRLSFNSAVFQACCVDVTVIPYLTKEVNISLGCYGCRDATDIAEDECLVGIPFEQLGGIIESIEALSKKAMPQAREKRTYSQFIKSEEAIFKVRH
ncbi:MAG: DUF169 domain-containing protein [Candidatus Bathyarchaeia archaeon]